MRKTLLIIILVLFIFLFNFRLLIYNLSFYQKEFDKLNISIPKELALTNTKNLFSYFQNNKDLTTDFFNEREKFHLKDVKNLIYKTLILLYIIIVLLIVLIILNYKTLGKSLIISGITSIIIILSFYFINFEDFFNNTFHKLLFNNDLYLLDPSKDNLINLFPYEFFKDFAYKLFFNSFILSIIIIVFGLFLLKRKYFFNILHIKSK